MNTDEKKMQADKEQAERIIKRFELLKSGRVNWESHWQACMENIVPRKEDVISTRLPGDRRNSDLYDTTAILANEMLAAALHGMLTNPETRFFELSFGDPALDEDEAVKNWCQDVGDRMFRVLNNTNFQTEIYEIYIDLGAIGTSSLFIGEHKDNVVHFSARAMKEIFIDENNLGLIDVVYRHFKWNARQIIQEFGEANVPPEVLQLNEKGQDDKMEIIHAVEPMSDVDKKASIKKHEYSSVYVLREKKAVLSKDGFREFPYAVPRWSKTTGETYGRGPGMAMLPDILMVNAMMLTTLQGAQKTVDPPLMVSDDGVIGTVRLTPGGLTIVRPGEQNQIKPLITDARVDFGYQCIEDVRKRIRAGFYVDQLQLQDGPQMTAEEVRQRSEEKLRLMGPVLGRQHFEFLKPVIERVFAIMSRKSLFPAAPQKIRGKAFDVRYSSLIARAQRMSEGQNLGRAMQLGMPLVQAAPSTMDLVDTDEALRYIFEVYGVPHRLMRTQVDIKKRRDMQAKMAQQQQQQINEQHQAGVANQLAPVMDAATRAKQSAAQG